MSPGSDAVGSTSTPRQSASLDAYRAFIMLTLLAGMVLSLRRRRDEFDRRLRE